MTEEQAAQIRASGEPVYYIGRYAYLRKTQFYIHQITKHGVWISPIKNAINHDSCHIVQLKNLITQQQWQQHNPTLRKQLLG